MSSWLVILLVLACVLGNAIFSGAETAWYRASRVRLEMEERRGSRAARAMLRLARSDTASVVLFVLGVNVCVESSIFLVEGHFDELQAPGYVVELVMALVLTPLFFLFGDLVPKEIARRRPHATLRLVGLPVAALRVPALVDFVQRTMAQQAARKAAADAAAAEAETARNNPLTNLPAASPQATVLLGRH